MDSLAALGNRSAFFKFILDETICEGKLMLPKTFARKHGNYLPSLVSLELPTGARWQVELLKNSTIEIWFGRGWEEFARHCSLAHGNALVFKYDRNSALFRVQVFEGTGLEIDYPNRPDVELDMEEDEIFEISGEGRVKRASVVKMEENEDNFHNLSRNSTRKRVKRPSMLNSERTRERGNMLRENVRKQAERASKPNRESISQEDEDDYEDDDDDDFDEDDDDVQPVLRKNTHKQIGTSSKLNKEKILEDEDEDYARLLHGKSARKPIKSSSEFEMEENVDEDLMKYMCGMGDRKSSNVKTSANKPAGKHGTKYPYL